MTYEFDIYQEYSNLFKSVIKVEASSEEEAISKIQKMTQDELFEEAETPWQELSAGDGSEIWVEDNDYKRITE